MVGWAVMAGMVYLIMVTTPVHMKLWNPYDILGISDVRASCLCSLQLLPHQKLIELLF